MSDPATKAIRELEQLQRDYEVAKEVYGRDRGDDFTARWEHRIKRAADDVQAVRSEHS